MREQAHMRCSRNDIWRLADRFHSADYESVLPVMARLPLHLGYALADVRGKINALVGRDWRSVALRCRHVQHESAKGFQTLFPDADALTLNRLVRRRFETESREEFEAALIAADRANQLRRTIEPDNFLQSCLNRNRGLVLLTPHFDSFALGIVFLGQAGVKVNAMSSSVIFDARVASSVQQHFIKKYRGMERQMNGGRILHQEDGLKPFYRMLENNECLVVLADAPATATSSQSVQARINFLGGRRLLAGGALRIAQNTGSELGGFICRYEGPMNYRVIGSRILDAANPTAADEVYGFLSGKIMASPQRWWASDLLPMMPRLVD